jgi:hypothetical protein
LSKRVKNFCCLYKITQNGRKESEFYKTEVVQNWKIIVYKSYTWRQQNENKISLRNRVPWLLEYFRTKMFRTNIALRTKDAQTSSSKKTSRLFDGEWNPGGAGVSGIGALGPEKNYFPSLRISISFSLTSYQIIFRTPTFRFHKFVKKCRFKLLLSFSAIKPTHLTEWNVDHFNF